MPANKEHTEATPSSLAVAAGEYLDYLAVERGLARNTIAAYRRDLTTYCAYLERAGIVSFEEVTRQVVEGFVADRRDGGYSDASVERALAAVKGLHAFLVRDGAVAQNPTAALRLPKKAERLPEYLSVEDVSALLDQDFPEGEMGLRDHAILEVLYGCGLRVSELVGLDVGDIHIDDGFVLVRGKGSKERLSPLVGSAARALTLYLTEGRSRLAAHARGTETSAVCRARASMPSVSATGARWGWWGSIPIPCATPLPPTCSRAVPTCVCCRRFWAMPISRPRRSTRMSTARN